MSASDIRVDYSQLGDLRSNLDLAIRVVDREFESMATLAYAVGHYRLGIQGNAFRDSWDKRRLDTIQKLQWLRDSVQQIESELSNVDQTLSDGLTQPASGAAPNIEAV